MELLLPDKDLMPLGHVSECTSLMNNIDEIKAIMDESSVDETKKETLILVTGIQLDVIEMAILIYKRILIRTHRDKIIRRV